MNPAILLPEVQAYIHTHIDDDVNQVALSNPVFAGISSAELAGQLSAKRKAKHKLPLWFSRSTIYYPPLLSIEQTSSAQTAEYKAGLAVGESLIDLTAGFGVDSYFFSKRVKEVTSCELNPELASISGHNAKVLGAENITCIAGDGIEFLRGVPKKYGTIYIDPARRSNSAKVFRLEDCTPNVLDYLDLFLEKAQRIIIKTSPLLDISAGWAALKNVSEIHIVSVKNECKELLWVIDHSANAPTRVICAALNAKIKTFDFPFSARNLAKAILADSIEGYLYEPDVALLKSGAFNLIGERFGLKKLHPQSQLYVKPTMDPTFVGRIFQVQAVLSPNELKKERELVGNVIVRNFPEKAENLVRKYKIRPSHDDFIIFTKTENGFAVIRAKIVQHY